MSDGVPRSRKAGTPARRCAGRRGEVARPPWKGAGLCPCAHSLSPRPRHRGSWGASRDQLTSSHHPHLHPTRGLRLYLPPASDTELVPRAALRTPAAKFLSSHPCWDLGAPAAPAPGMGSPSALEKELTSGLVPGGPLSSQQGGGPRVSPASASPPRPSCDAEGMHPKWGTEGNWYLFPLCPQGQSTAGAC